MNYWGPHPSSDDKETTHVVVCLRVLHKSSFKALSRRDPAGTAKKVRNVQKKCAARAKLLFCLINLSWPIPFFAISLLLGLSRLCSATFEQLLAFGATFCGFSNLEQVLPFRAIFEQNIGLEHISSTKKSTISWKTSIHANFLKAYHVINLLNT